MQTQRDSAKRSRNNNRAGRVWRQGMVHRLWLVAVIGTMSASAQWLAYPTPGMPRTADGKPDLSAPAPKTVDGKSCLSGLWVRVRNPRERVTALAMGPNLEDFMRPGENIPPLLPAAEELHRKRMANFMADRPSAHCLPHGIPDQWLIGNPVKIVQDPGLTIILYEQNTHYRQIFTDGRPHPPRRIPPGWAIRLADGMCLVCGRYTRVQRQELDR
jgi:hypothetical protein